MKRLLRAALLALALLVSGSQAAQLAAQDNAVAPRLQALANGLKPQHGKIAIPGANATLDLGRDYDFYGGPDIRTILVDLWDNPPGSEEGVLGLVMPAGASPLSDSWGAVIGYEETGYVPDDDAASADYGQILSDLKQNAEDANPERKNQGYPAMHMVGWAENPHYQAATHSVVWARDLQLEGVPVDTLNYDLRTLGRKGVLSVNFISGMPNLAGIRVAAGNFAEHASFDPGARYQDFDSATDKKAEYGIAGLVAAGVGVAAVKKLGPARDHPQIRQGDRARGGRRAGRGAQVRRAAVRLRQGFARGLAYRGRCARAWPAGRSLRRVRAAPGRAPAG